jgi:hypothetical protein
MTIYPPWKGTRDAHWMGSLDFHYDRRSGRYIGPPYFPLEEFPGPYRFIFDRPPDEFYQDRLVLSTTTYSINGLRLCVQWVVLAAVALFVVSLLPDESRLAPPRHTRPPAVEAPGQREASPKRKATPARPSGAGFDIGVGDLLCILYLVIPSIMAIAACAGFCPW